MPAEETEKTFIYEVAGAHYESEGVMNIHDENGEILEAIAQRIWGNKNCRLAIKEALAELSLLEQKQ